MLSLRRFDIIGWATGRASDLQQISLQTFSYTRRRPVKAGQPAVANREEAR